MAPTIVSAVNIKWKITRMNLPRRFFLLPLFTFLACALPAFSTHAHTSHPESSTFRAGLLHPFTGLDHLLAMIAVGLWTAQLGRTARWLVPTAFLVAMLVGSALATTHTPLPTPESLIATSVLTLGLLIAFATRLPLFIASAIVALFALFHGYVHLTEAPAGSLAQYTAGFTLSTLLLHAIGLTLGLSLSRINQPSILRTCGAGVALAGIYICFTI